MLGQYAKLHNLGSLCNSKYKLLINKLFNKTNHPKMSLTLTLVLNLNPVDLIQ